MITLIAAIGKNNEIGAENRLLWNIPEDMKHFKEYTLGKVVVMGRKTFESIGRPLSGRKSIVLSSGTLGNMAVTAHSVDDVLSIEHCYPELVIIGGSTVYNQFIEHADKLIITHVDAGFDADSFFPQIDDTVWKINTLTEGFDENYKYKFVEYTRYEARRIVD